MAIEILYNEVCGLYGDAQNAAYLHATVPDAEIIYTKLNEEPYFVSHDPELIYIGNMSEATQRKVIQKLLPYRDRLAALVDKGTPILATGNAGHIFMREIQYVTEEITVSGLNFFDATVKTNLFDRYNGKVLGTMNDDLTVVGFRSQFSMTYGDNTNGYFVKCIRGDGINRESQLEGFRKSNLICTEILGPIFPINPLFCEYFLGLAGIQATAAHKDAAMAAYLQRVQEFNDPKVEFGHNH